MEQYSLHFIFWSCFLYTFSALVCCENLSFKSIYFFIDDVSIIDLVRKNGISETNQEYEPNFFNTSLALLGKS